MSNDTRDARARVVKVRPEHEMATMQRLPYFVGISASTAGTTGLSMYMVVVPPGGHAEPHYHADYETAIYQLEGRIETRLSVHRAGRSASAVQSRCYPRRARDRRAQPCGRT